MKKEKSAGAVIVRMVRGEPHFLLLHYPSSADTNLAYWDLPKGHMEKGETEMETAIREVREETGLAVTLSAGFRKSIHYMFQSHGEEISKTVIFFLALSKEKKVKISSEHVGFMWLPYHEALERLTYENARRVVRGAYEYLQKQKKAAV